MIITDEFRLDENRRELLSSLSDEYPYVCLDVTLDRLIGRGWHWHSAFEIDYVTAGDLQLQTPQHTFTVHTGDIVFINSRIMHDARALSRNEDCHLYAQLFDPLFLSGLYGGLLEQKYLQPVLECTSLDVWTFRHDAPDSLQIFQYVCELLRLNQSDSFGWELKIRSVLSELWCALLEQTSQQRAAHVSEQSVSPDTERLRTMIQFVHEHYMEDLNISDIAASASISLRECNRCFQKNVGIPPLTFLTRYRLRIAARMLETSGESVIRICNDCGFHSPGYFGKLFREMFGCPPRQYRMKHVKAPAPTA